MNFSLKPITLNRIAGGIGIGLAGLAALIVILGWAMTQALNVGFPFNQTDTSYLVHGQILQILDESLRLGRDYFIYPGYGPVALIAWVKTLFYTSAETAQSVTLLLSLLAIWGMVALLASVALIPLTSRARAITIGLLGASMAVIFTPLTTSWLPPDPGLLALRSALPFVGWPLCFWLLHTRLGILAGIGFLPCILWAPDYGLAMALVLAGAMTIRFYRRPLRLVIALIIGLGLALGGLWQVTGGALPDYLGRMVGIFYESFWLNGPYDPAARYWSLGDLLIRGFARDGLVWGALLLGLGAIIGTRTHQKLLGFLIGLHLILMIGGYGSEWIAHIAANQLLPARYSAFGIIALLVATRLPRPPRPVGPVLSWGIMTGMAAIAVFFTVTNLPGQFNRSESKDRARCLFHDNCPKPIADRSAALIQAWQQWLMMERIPDRQRVLAAYPTWINGMLVDLLANAYQLPGIRADYAMGRNRTEWLDTMANRPYRVAITEAPGIFPEQPFMTHSLWWLYREIARQMVPIDNDYRFVFWLRRNQIGQFAPSPIECSIVTGDHHQTILIPAPATGQAIPEHQLYELHLEWQLANPVTGRFLVVADKPGLFAQSHGFGLNPYVPNATIPLRSLKDFVVLRAFQERPLDLQVKSCEIWQITAPDAAMAIFGNTP